MLKTNSFAKQQLSKYGWDDGKGLGRLENGIKNAIKVKVKNNKGGLGHDQGSEFTFHWWDHIFNKTANSIKVNENEDSVEIEKEKNPKKTVPVLISNKKPLRSSFAGVPLLYGTFVKSGTYNGGEESSVFVESDSDTSSGDEDFSSKDTLEKTFRKTGFTGHKAARHGLQLSGKLQRIQEQEIKGDNKSAEKGKSKSVAVEEIVVVSNIDNKKVKKKKKKSKNDEQLIEKKKKKKIKDDDEIINGVPKKKKKKT